jgi:hypothetical protein
MPNDNVQIIDEEVAQPVADVTIPATVPESVETTVDDTKPEVVIDFSDFSKGEITSKVEKPIAEEDKEEVKEPAKVDDKAAPVEKPVPLDTNKKKVTTLRDYSDIPVEVKPLFERMSNEAFNHFKPLLKEHETLQKKIKDLEENPPRPKDALPENYYEHQNGFILSPEYIQYANSVNEAQSVVEHWKSQLDSVREGAKTYQGLVRDPNTKQIVLGPVQNVDNRTQSYLEQTFMGANTQSYSLSAKLNELQNSFAGKHTQALNDVRAFEKQMFPDFEDPKHPMNAVIQDTLRQINPVFRKNPLAILVAKYAVQAQTLITALNDAKKPAGTVVTNKVKDAQSKAGPTSSGVIQDTTSLKKEITFDDFKTLMEI